MSAEPHPTDAVSPDENAARAYSDSEFGLLSETAADLGLAWRDPVVERVSRGDLSALRWGSAEVDVVLLHGAGQNAHTWDSVMLALSATGGDIGVLAVDLPGHGRSRWRDDHDYGPQTNAAAVARFLAHSGVDPAVIVGMSLGGLTAIAMGRVGQRLTQRVLVDVTPSAATRAASMARGERDTTILMEGPRTFDSLTEMIDATHAVSPARSRAAIRRGVLHNSRRDDEGRWAWRYDTPARFDAEDLWSGVAIPGIHTTLIRGAGSAFVIDADVTRLLLEEPTADVEMVEGAGHSVQGDQPLALATLLRGVIDRT